MFRRLCLLGLVFLALPLFADSPARPLAPSVLVLYDGPDAVENPGRLDALYLANLLGHFTTHRTVLSLEQYRHEEWRKYDAVFSIIFQKTYRVPQAFLADVPEMKGIVCWLGNQGNQLEQVGALSHHGLSFELLSDKVKLNRVAYKGYTVAKGDPETNIFRVKDPSVVQVIATVTGPEQPTYPYIMKSGSFWIVADSPFSYSAENDRYLVFADVLHDILGIDHPEAHRAMLRVEDLNARTNPGDMKAVYNVIRKFDIPFSFAYVPTYINPHERAAFRLVDKPDVLKAILGWIQAGGVPVLHGYTHQYRGVTTDDYEFWDDLGDRPVRGDSEAFAARRVEEAIKESMHAGIFPTLWETPHYAGSLIDYKVFKRYFDTVFERRLVANRLGTDQFFPYPVIDINGQYVIPESLSYVPIEDPAIEPLLENASAVRVVRDGYASFFFHPFLKPELLTKLIAGIQERGFKFVDLRTFPNRVQMPGRLLSNVGGTFRIDGHGRYLEEFKLGPKGNVIDRKTVEASEAVWISRTVELAPGETYVAWRQDAAPPSWFQKLLAVAKGDVSILQRKLETVMTRRSLREPVKSAVFWNARARDSEARDQESFYTVLTRMGFDLEKIEYSGLVDEDLGPFSLLVLPQAAAKSFDQDDVEKVMGAVKRGIVLITDGPSPVANALGVRLGEPYPVFNLTDQLFTDQETRWPGRPQVPWVKEPSADELTVYYADPDMNRPLVVGGNYGEGRFLYYAPLFDPESAQGYSRFPNLPQLLINELHLDPIIRRRGADVYFDPGYRQGISIEILAKMWKRFGVRAVHVAAWHFYEKYSYDYARLVRVAHQNGILVYAWFEWPHVSQRFWDRHPTWREKTAKLTDAHVDWRYHMNFQNPDCFKAIMADAKDFLKAYDWDGINLGEFTFESPAGPNLPATLTPFNSVAIQEFSRLSGFDPTELFRDASPHYWKKDPDGWTAFVQYRKDLNYRMLKSVVESFQKMSKESGRDWEIVLTLLDGLGHPELQDHLGFDLARTIGLIRRNGLTLQAEDPASEWSKSPDRYLEMGRRYDGLGLKSPFMIDINVLAVHPSNQAGFATSKPTGSELFQLWHSASESTPRVCLYSESSVNEQDWEVLPYGMGARATVQKDGDEWIVKTPFTVQLALGREARRIKLDGQPWFCVDKGDVWVPAGEHRVSFARLQRSWFDRSQLDTHLLGISGELLGSQRVARGLEVEYRSLQRCALVFDKAPYKIYVDDKPVKLSVLKGDDGYTIMAPKGQHHLRVVTQTALLYFVEFTSLMSASLIVLFGLASSGLLAFLFIFITLHRRTHRIRRFLKGLFS